MMRTTDVRQNSVHLTCIIPFYNEEKRITAVLTCVSQVPSITQIICVDDGSNDNSAEQVKRYSSNIQLIRMDKNSGKAQAVFRGLQFVKSNHILLLDADLEQLHPEELEAAYRKFQDNDADMVILKIKGANAFIDELLRKYIFQGGNRILKKNDLDEIAKINPKGYQLEVATNDYMLDNKKDVFWTPCSAFNPHKSQKLSLIKGLQKDFAMDREIISYLGLKKYLQQVVFFCRQKR